MSYYILSLPEILTDNWLENFYYIEDKEIVYINCSNVRWIELSTLIVLLLNISNTLIECKEIHIIFPDYDLNEDTNKIQAFLFLIESGFYIALKNSMPRTVITIDVNLESKQRNSIDKLVDSVNDYANLYMWPEMVPNQACKESNSIISINVDKIIESGGLKKEIFSIVGYKREAFSDYFLLPIQYVLNESGEFEDFSIDFKRSIRKKDNSSFIEPREIENEVIDIWLRELLLNAFEHGEGKIFFYIRCGGYARRMTVINKYNEKFYKVKSSFLNKISNKQYDFIEVGVIDSGQGFVSLTDTYTNEHRKLPKINEMQVLHRYALFPHTSRKQNKTERILRITGLGILAEKIILRDGCFFIKDHGPLTYFDSSALKRTSDVGYADILSTKDLGSTFVSALIPTYPKDFEDNYSISKITSFKGNVALLGYLEVFNDCISESVIIYKEAIGARHVIDKRISVDSLSSLKNIPIVLDMCEVSVVQKKLFSDIYSMIKGIRKNNLCIIVNAEISHMKLIQAFVESERKMKNIYKKDVDIFSFFCVVISVNFDLFIAGTMKNGDRQYLYNFINGKKNIFPKKHLNKFLEGRLPLETIERTINKHRGNKFKKELRIRHYQQGPIQDMYGNILDCFYEVKDFLSLNKLNISISKDIHRIVSRYNVENVIVDCREVREILNKIKYEYGLDLNIAKFYIDSLEFNCEESLQSKEWLVILASSSSGKTLKAIRRAIKEWAIQVKAVVVLLDIGRFDRENASKILGCPYDRFAKDIPPQIIYEHGVEPTFICNNDARLIPSSIMAEDFGLNCKVLIPTNIFFGSLEWTNCLYTGHTKEHSHHYDLFLDVRSILSGYDNIYYIFKSFIMYKINQKGIKYIFYPEESELSPIISSIQYGKGNVKIEFCSARKTAIDGYWFKANLQGQVRDNNIMIIDEGIYSCSSLIEMLKVLSRFKPKSVDVVVIEKRLAYKSRVSELNMLLENSSCPIDIHSVVEFNVPCWTNNSDDCPYCRHNYKFSKDKPEYFDIEFEFNGIKIDNFAYLIYLLGSELYKSQKNAYNVIEFCRNIKRMDYGVYRLLINYLKIHVLQLVKWNLLHAFADEIEKCFADSCSDDKVFDLHWLKKTYSHVRNVIGPRFIKRSIEVADHNGVQSEIYSLLKNNRELIDVAKRYFENQKHILGNEICSVWKTLFYDVVNINRARLVERFFKTTRLNYARTHKTLLELMSDSGYKSDSFCVRKFKIKKILEKLPPIPILEEFKESLDDEVLLREFLSDESRLVRIKRSLSISALELLKILSEVCMFDFDENYFEELYRTKSGEYTIVPLLCIQSYNVDELKSYFQDNIKYGPSDIRYKFSPEDEIQHFYINIEHLTVLKEGSENCLDCSPSFQMLKKSLKSDEVKISYICSDARKLSIEIQLRMVDYVSV